MQITILIAIGLFAGVLSGMFGIGGGLVIVPCLVAFLGLGPKQAIGTSLAAILLPVGILGVLEHYRAGNVNVRYALLVDVGVFVGALIGARIVIDLPKDTVRQLFAAFLVAVAVKMFLGK